MFVCCQAIAQTNDGCMNGISTNPLNPVNPQTNSTYMQAPEYINSSFNWYQRLSQNSLAPWVSDNMIYDVTNSFGGPNYYISPFDPNGTPWAQGYFPTNYDDMDFFPEDGWELLYINMGKFPNGTTTTTRINSTPYVVLYNKFRSIIRVFGKTGDLDYVTSPIRSVQVKFNFRSTDPNNQTPISGSSDEVSGLFTGQNTYINALDKETEVYQIVSLVNHPNTVNQWFHADFHVNYDPCSCWFKSDLQLSFKFLSSQSIQLVGRSVSMEMPISSSGNVDYGKSFLTNIYTDGDDETGVGAEAVAGSVIYKSMDAMVADYEAKLSVYTAYNPNSKELKRAKTIYKVYTTIKSTAVNYFGGQLAEEVLKYAPDIIKNIQGAIGTNFEVKIDPDDTKKMFIKELGNMSKGLDALVEHKLGLDQTAPAKPTMPMATFTEMSLSGNIKTSSTTTIPSLMNPGTYNDNTVANGQFGTSEILSTLRYPIYNEALGTFAFLETPKLKKYVKSDVIRTFVSGATQIPDPQYAPYDCESSIEYTSSTKFRNSFKLEPLKFYFNPATDINLSKTQMRFQLIFDGNPTIDLNSLPFTVTNLNKNVFGGNPVSYVSPVLSVDCLQDLIMEFNTPQSNYTSEYLGVQHPCNQPISYEDYFNNHDFTGSMDGADFDETFYTGLFNGINNNKIYLKVMVDAEYNSLDKNGIPNKNTLVQTYELIAEEVNTDFAQVIPFDVTNVPVVETIETIHFTQNGNYNPLEMLSVIGILTSNDGLNHNLFAQEEVAILAEGAVIASNTSDFNLEIHPLFACSGNSNPVTATEVNTFCNSNTYKANKLKNPSVMRVANNTNTQSRFIAPPSIDLNTTMNESSKLNLTSKNENDFKRNFKLIDLQGRVLVTAQYLPSEIDMSNYSTGIYIVEYQTEKGSVRKKVIKSN